MALMKCRDCGKRHSEHAPACPSCGRPNYRALHQPDPAEQYDAPASAKKPPRTGTIIRIVIQTIVVVVSVRYCASTNHSAKSGSPAAAPAAGQQAPAQTGSTGLQEAQEKTPEPPVQSTQEIEQDRRQQGIQIPHEEPNITYWLLGARWEQKNIVRVLTKQITRHDVGFTDWRINCDTRMARVLRYGDDRLSELSSQGASQAWFALIEGSSKSDTAVFVCRGHRTVPWPAGM